MTAPCWPSPQPPSPGIPGPDGVSGGTVTPGPVGLYLSARMVFLDYWGPYEGIALHAQSNARVPQILATCRLNAARLRWTCKLDFFVFIEFMKLLREKLVYQFFTN